jgi:hypothetical protein
LAETDLPSLVEIISAAHLDLAFGPRTGSELVRLVRTYDPYLLTLAEWLVIDLPEWFPSGSWASEPEGADEVDGFEE